MSSGGHRDVVLLTGASTGLGLAVARLLLGTQYRLILTARASSLARFAAAGIVESEHVHLRPLDVTSDAERRAVVAEAAERWGGVHALINNAGIACRSVIEHVDAAGAAEIFEVNYHGPLELIRLVLPGMRRRRAGRIVSVSSVAGMVAMPTLALYSASKFALEGACEALWYEMRPFGIHVTLVQPGFIRSTSFQNTRYTEASERGRVDINDPYHAHYTHMDRLITSLMQGAPDSPEHVARRIVRVLERRDPPLRVAGTLDAHLFVFLRRFLPRGFFHRFLYARLPRIASWGRMDGP